MCGGSQSAHAGDGAGDSGHRRVDVGTRAAPDDLRVYDKSQLLNAINYAVMPALIGPIFGPLVGGYLVEYASWHWIFLLNLPIGLLGVLLGWRIMPDVKGKNTVLDLSGYLTFASAACLLMLAVEMVSHSGAVWFSLLLAIGGTAFALLYYRHMKTAANPIYAADLFQSALSDWV